MSGGDGGPGGVKLPLIGVALVTVTPGMFTAALTAVVLHATWEPVACGREA
ncbi:MAG: hypothetical protein JO262_06245 [Solirubrobacterales bacterium]|nr:hypothetical protein [Solirubrobacterales bacterium]